MFRLFASIFFLVASSAVAAQQGSVPVTSLDSLSGTVGGTAVPPAMLAGTYDVFSIYAGDASSTGVIGDFYPFYRDGVPYKTPAGLNAHCFGFTAITDTAGSAFQFVSDTSAIGFAQSAALTSGVFQAGVTNRGALKAITASVNNFIPGSYTFGPNRYTAFQQRTNTVVLVVTGNCFESFP